MTNQPDLGKIEPPPTHGGFVLTELPGPKSTIFGMSAMI